MLLRLPRKLFRIKRLRQDQGPALGGALVVNFLISPVAIIKDPEGSPRLVRWGVPAAVAGESRDMELLKLQLAGDLVTMDKGAYLCNSGKR